MGFFAGFVSLHSTFPLFNTHPSIYPFYIHPFNSIHLLVYKPNHQNLHPYQFSGFALTTSVLYISLQVHKANRLEQRNAIREQTRALNWLASSAGAYDRRLLPQETQKRPGEQEDRATKPALKDFLKHRWNQEVETLARKAYESRWEDARDTAVEGWKTVMRLVKKE
ncbi:unnamed protein product [Aspergillus niger]|nr:unnamed protein product [Aspergillus niger]